MQINLYPLFVGHMPGEDKRGNEIIPEERLQIILLSSITRTLGSALSSHGLRTEGERREMT